MVEESIDLLIIKAEGALASLHGCDDLVVNLLGEALDDGVHLLSLLLHRQRLRSGDLRQFRVRRLQEIKIFVPVYIPVTVSEVFSSTDQKLVWRARLFVARVFREISVRRKLK